MKAYTKFFAAILLTPLSPAPAFAQSAPTTTSIQEPAQTPSPSPASSESQSQPLSLPDAEKIAIANHPRVQAAQDIAIAASERVREARSNYYPTTTGNLTGAESETNSRIAAGSLTNSIIYDRFAEGVEVTQLLTDFGRTHELVKSSHLHAQAEQANIVTARADVLLRVDEAYYSLLRAQTVLQVATETVKDRQVVANQIGALEKNQLKSQLDLSFANVDLSQAQLLLIQSTNDVQSATAEFAAALGYADQRTFQLAEPELSTTAPPPNIAGLIQQALRDRPELASQRLDVSSARTYATAERDLSLPTISAVGEAGLIPYHADQLSPRYAAAGFNVNIPIFNGHLNSALRSEANAQAHAQEQYLRNLEETIVRDVQQAWLAANSGYQRLAVTDQLLDQATLALNLSQARYKLGLSSIVEVSQSQLNWTQAKIAQATARYNYQSALSALNYQTGALH
jgi:outer membrane protein